MDYILISKKKSFNLIVIGLLLTTTAGAPVDEKDAVKPSGVETDTNPIENLRAPRGTIDEELKRKLLALDDSDDYGDFSAEEDPNTPRKLTRYTTPVRAGERFDPTLFESGSMEEVTAPPAQPRKNVEKSKTKGVNKQHMASTVRPKRMPSPSIQNDESTSPLVNSLEMDSSPPLCNYPGCLGQQMIPAQSQFINADYEFLPLPWSNPQKILAKRESASDKMKTPSEIKSSQVFFRPSKPQQAPMPDTRTGSHNNAKEIAAPNHFMHNSHLDMTHSSDEVYTPDKISQNFENEATDSSDINRNPYIQFIPLTIHKVRLTPAHTHVEEIPFDFVRQQTDEMRLSPEEIILQGVHQRLHQYQHDRLKQQEQVAQPSLYDFMEGSPPHPHETFYPRRVPEEEEAEYDSNLRQPHRVNLEGEGSQEFDQRRFIQAQAPYARISLVGRHPVAVDMNDDVPMQFWNPSPSYDGDMPSANRAPPPVQWEREYEQGYNPMSNHQAGYESQRMSPYSTNNEGVRILNHGESGLHKREMPYDYVGYMSE